MSGNTSEIVRRYEIRDSDCDGTPIHDVYAVTDEGSERIESFCDRKDAEEYIRKLWEDTTERKDMAKADIIKRTVRRDPARLLAMDEGDAHDELVDAIADYIVHDPKGACEIHMAEFDGVTRHEYRVIAEISNTVGPTVSVDGILEALNLRDWRMVCDRILSRMLTCLGENAADYDWPTPVPEITHIPEEDLTDVHGAVRINWAVDEKTWRMVTKFNRTSPRGEKASGDDGGKEDALFSFRHGDRSVVMREAQDEYEVAEGLAGNERYVVGRLAFREDAEDLFVREVRKITKNWADID